MIQGGVNAAHEVVVRLAVRGTAGPTRECAAVSKRGATSYGAHVPDQPGCAAVARHSALTRGAMARLSERGTRIADVMGSNPIRSIS